MQVEGDALMPRPPHRQARAIPVQASDAQRCHLIAE